MKKFLSVVTLAIVFSVPSFAQASIFNELVGAVKDLQKQVVDLVSIKIDLPKTSVATSTADKSWILYTNSDLGFEVRFPGDWSTTTVFAQTAKYAHADAFVRNSRADFLAKIVKPSSSALEIAVQDSAVFFQSAERDVQISELSQWTGRVSTSSKEIGSTTALYVLHSVKTDPAKFGGGSTEKYVFRNGSSTIVAEANYSSDVPVGPVKIVFDRMVQSFSFTATELGTSTQATSTTQVTASSSDPTRAEATSTVLIQTAGASLSR